jgi:hypothetical protein
MKIEDMKKAMLVDTIFDKPLSKINKNWKNIYNWIKWGDGSNKPTWLHLQPRPRFGSLNMLVWLSKMVLAEHFGTLLAYKTHNKA